MEKHKKKEETLPPVDYDSATLRLRKVSNDETNESLSVKAGTSITTITAVMQGKPTVKLLTMQRVAAKLGLQVQIQFIPLETLSPIGTTAGSGKPEMARKSETGRREGKPGPNVQWNASRTRT